MHATLRRVAISGRIHGGPRTGAQRHERRVGFAPVRGMKNRPASRGRRATHSQQILSAHVRATGFRYRLRRSHLFANSTPEPVATSSLSPRSSFSTFSTTRIAAFSHATGASPSTSPIVSSHSICLPLTPRSAVSPHSTERPFFSSPFFRLARAAEQRHRPFITRIDGSRRRGLVGVAAEHRRCHRNVDRVAVKLSQASGVSLLKPPCPVRLVHPAELIVRGRIATRRGPVAHRGNVRLSE